MVLLQKNLQKDFATGKNRNQLSHFIQWLVQGSDNPGLRPAFFILDHTTFSF